MSAMSFRAGPGGATRTFAFDRGLRLVGMASFAVLLLIISAVIVSPAGTQAGFSAWGKIATLALADIPTAWFATRWSRLSVGICRGT